MNKLDELLNFNHQALNLRSQRQQVLASNIANADTPGYKARDFDFKSALATAVAQPAATQPAGGAAPAPRPELLYRSVIQPSIDGNTVDMDVERAQFAENTCVVFGMPKEAIAAGGVDEIVPLQEMSRQVLAHLAQMGSIGVRV